MHIDLEARRARLSVGEFSDFALGPRDAGEGPAGIWRAQLGTRWHQQLRAQTAAEQPNAGFEVAVEGALAIAGWTIVLNGRIDQYLRAGPAILVREIKTVTRALPDGENLLRADYPGYFVQLAAYVALLNQSPLEPGGPPPRPPVRGELIFVETATGLSQAVSLAEGDARMFDAQIARVAEFLNLRLRARDRQRGLQFSPPFAELRPGQETVVADLQTQVDAAAPPASGGPTPRVVLLEAPPGFGKTGVLLEFALGALRAGRFERVLYLSGKSSGQLQVGRTLAAMAPPAGAGGPAVWTVRPKSEHCVNHAFHCVREDCGYLDGVERRWTDSGLARFYLLDNQPRDLPTLRAAGREAGVCPYEITRASLPFNDVWVGDYNYVFSPGSRGLFFHQPGFEPARTLLIIDEAHNLPARVADAYSHVFSAAAARGTAVLLDSISPGAPLTLAWSRWTAFLDGLAPCGALRAGAEADARDLIQELAACIREQPVDYAALSPAATEAIWEIPGMADNLAESALTLLWWCRQPGSLSVTCLDAAPAIGAVLAAFGGVVLASATPGPADDLAEALGLSVPPEPAPAPAGWSETGRLGKLTKRETKRLAGQVLTGAALLRQAEGAGAALAVVRARTPWRDGAYDVAFDVRVDTTFQHRSRHATTTAATVAALCRGDAACAAIFFSSYAYAELIREEFQASYPRLRASLQPRALELAAQAPWVERELAEADALFLILGSSFAESVDLLGGRIGCGMVVGPALPEVNPVQHARLAALAPLGRDAAFRRVYQVPGMQKVNQALGRLVRAPGQRAKILLHCRRFAEPTYRNLLAADYQQGWRIEADEDLETWLGRI